VRYLILLASLLAAPALAKEGLTKDGLDLNKDLETKNTIRMLAELGEVNCPLPMRWSYVGVDARGEIGKVDCQVSYADTRSWSLRSIHLNGAFRLEPW
jgi:hypothetical protein